MSSQGLWDHLTVVEGQIFPNTTSAHAGVYAAQQHAIRTALQQDMSVACFFEDDFLFEPFRAPPEADEATSEGSAPSKGQGGGGGRGGGEGGSKSKASAGHAAGPDPNWINQHEAQAYQEHAHLSEAQRMRLIPQHLTQALRRLQLHDPEWDALMLTGNFFRFQLAYNHTGDGRLIRDFVHVRGFGAVAYCLSRPMMEHISSVLWGCGIVPSGTFDGFFYASGKVYATYPLLAIHPPNQSLRHNEAGPYLPEHLLWKPRVDVFHHMAIPRV
ncbi:hypothetical protein PTSG_07146 [Salpingoeca rosetta]|uniref:Uncharacterized protein n=1 Tax=Salpingoeca rosetta (strain ATCC 50818 / BSB-021) TaxID=946362 RepID=F2UE69_SALR5|nr:uncharacterized protein PTSG_07146 [Salpingoeca rosetta]EGD74919.1 hypothetical protein PTSG_07146 [Salpingoeca rosetta]|eukprot:XP_004992564.1 hypothetical protein PTSG_07146 [Salpingoeca rosetta]